MRASKRSLIIGVLPVLAVGGLATLSTLGSGASIAPSTLAAFKAKPGSAEHALSTSEWPGRPHRSVHHPTTTTTTPGDPPTTPPPAPPPPPPPTAPPTTVAPTTLPPTTVPSTTVPPTTLPSPSTVPTIPPGPTTTIGPLPAGADQWLATVSMADTHGLSVNAVRLASGKALIVGESYYSDLYDPTTGNWTEASYNLPRVDSTFTVLADGRVLATGGLEPGLSVATPGATTEIYDPTTNTWSWAASMNVARASASATLLPNGDVLVAGGTSLAGTDLSSAELYDPATNTWTLTGSMGSARATFTLIGLPDGETLAAGGFGPQMVYASAELYDPATGTWTPTGAMHVARVYGAATLLPDGQVLVAGGNIDASLPADIYNPAAGTWTPTAPLHVARNGATATLLGDGRVLVEGGTINNTLDSEIYTPSTDTWALGSPMTTYRWGAAAVLLPDCNVLVAGGNGTIYNGVNPPDALDTAELFLPAAKPATCA